MVTMLRPHRAVRRCPVLWAERDTQQQYPQRKNYIISKQNRLNALATLPGRGPITTHLEGPHSHDKCHRMSVNCTKINPQPDSNAPRTLPQLCQSTTPGHNAQQTTWHWIFLSDCTILVHLLCVNGLLHAI